MRGRATDGLWTFVKRDPEDADAWMNIEESNGTREGLIEHIGALIKARHEQSQKLLHEADAMYKALTTTQQED